MKNFYWEEFVIVVLVIITIAMFIAGASCDAQEKAIAAQSIKDKENAARMYEVEAAELRGYSQALRDAGVAPSPKGGAK